MRPIVVLAIMITCLTSFSQIVPYRDTIVVESLPVIEITAFVQFKRNDNSAIKIDYLEERILNRINKSSLLPAINSISGVRMEERSPGSYRLNIRGSSLRSPFGVRNVKVYFNEIPLTDPGGNTYFNQLAVNNFTEIEILKGPAGSQYGSGTGGLVLLKSLNNNIKQGIDLEYTAGSYGLNNILTSLSLGDSLKKSKLTYAHLESEGYREHTRMRRDNISWVSAFRSNVYDFKVSVLLSDLYYQTPGGLTLKEFNLDPKKSRPATGALPSAIDAHAAIFQRNALIGFSDIIRISSRFITRNSLYIAYAHVENPTVRNYEIRREPHLGLRRIFQYVVPLKGKNVLNLSAGAETQLGFFNTRVASNIAGKPDSIQTDDDIRYNNLSLFAQADFTLSDKLFIVGGLSINNTNVKFRRISSFPIFETSRNYKNEFAPRISLKWKINPDMFAGATIAQGFSPPIISELLPSTSIISTNLEAEQGVNYELNLKHYFLDKSLKADITAYYFRLHNTLVQRRDNNGADYFINAGSTDQKGIETTLQYEIKFRRNKIINHIFLNVAYTLNQYKYNEFIRDTSDFTGKYLPGIPNNSFSFLGDFRFKNNIYLNLNLYAASSIFLNDGNTEKAKPYYVSGIKIGKELIYNKWAFNLYAGIENLFDEVYSLGNDINDARGRYYNVAPGRNYYIGLKCGFENW